MHSKCRRTHADPKNDGCAYEIVCRSISLAGAHMQWTQCRSVCRGRSQLISVTAANCVVPEVMIGCGIGDTDLRWKSGAPCQFDRGKKNCI